MAVPVLRTTHLARTVAWYGEVLGFRATQSVPGVVTLLRRDWVEFQLWQAPQRLRADEACIALAGHRVDIFEFHAQLARSVRLWIGATPALMPWGAWECSLIDCDGNRLRFLQWATGPLRGETTRRGAGHVTRPVDGRMDG